jgi:hypothetical protein
MFSPLIKALIVGSALLGVIFCLDSGPFFFSSYVPLPGVFSLYIYIYIYSSILNLAGTGKDGCAGGQKANNLLQQHNIVLIVGIVEDYSNRLSLLVSVSLMKNLQRLSP